MRFMNILWWLLSVGIIWPQDMGEAEKTKQRGERDSLIAAYIERDDHHSALLVLHAQIDELKSDARHDSLYKYVYNLGRSVSKVKSPEEGIAAAEQLVQHILMADTNTLHQLQALEDLSWIFFDLGMPEKALRTDMMYLELAEAKSHVSGALKSLACYNVGFDYMELGKWDKAIDYFKQSARFLDCAADDELIKCMDTYNALGAAYLRLGLLKEAKEAFEESRLHTSRVDDEGDRLFYLANIEGNLSLVYQDEGNLVKAKDALHNAMRFRKKGLQREEVPLWQSEQQNKQLASNYHNLAALYFDIGDYACTRQMLKLERAHKERILPPGHPEITRTLEGEASLQIALGQLDSALIKLNTYLETCYAHYGRESYFTASALQRLGRLYLSDLQYAKAIERLTEAIAVLKGISGEGMPQEIASCYLMRAEAFAGLDEREAALVDVNAAIEVFQKTREMVDQSKGEAMLSKAELLFGFGEFAAAQSVLDDALVQLSQKRQQRSEGSQLHDASFSQRLPDAYYLQAQLYMERSPADSARMLALGALEKAIALLADNKRSFRSSEAQIGLYESHRAIFAMRHRIAAEAFREQPNPTMLNKVFTNAEEARALLLRRQLTEFNSLHIAEVPDSLLRLERSLLAILNGTPLYNQQDAMQPDDADQLFADLQRTLARDYPDYYRLRYEEAVANLDDVQSKLLQEGQTLIRFIHHEEALHAMVVDKENKQLLELQTSDLASRIVALNRAITHIDQQAYRALAHDLYLQLMAPLLEHIKGHTLFIIPDGPLFALNFEVLLSGPEGQRSLLHEYTISYLHSATTALQFKELSSSTGQGTFAIAPGFSDGLKEAYAQSVPDTSFMDASYMRRIQQPFAVATAKRIGSMLNGRAYTGAAATELRFKEEAERFNVIHLGTHTEVNNLSPMLSRLVLSKEVEGAEDGYLHAYEIYNLPLRAELAVLTACETGVGKQVRSEGMMSLAHSFAYAGVPAIVMSLWQIDEKTSSEVIEYFYAYLAEGEPRNTALRKAKLKYLSRHGDELSAPYYWSGLVLIGDVEPISVERGVKYGWWIFLVLVVATALTLLAIKRRKTNA